MARHYCFACHGVWFVCYAAGCWSCCQIGSPRYETRLRLTKKWEKHDQKGGTIARIFMNKKKIHKKSYRIQKNVKILEKGLSDKEIIEIIS